MKRLAALAAALLACAGLAWVLIASDTPQVTQAVEKVLPASFGYSTSCADRPGPDGNLHARVRLDEVAARVRRDVPGDGDVAAGRRGNGG